MVQYGAAWKEARWRVEKTARRSKSDDGRRLQRLRSIEWETMVTLNFDFDFLRRV